MALAQGSVWDTATRSKGTGSSILAGPSMRNISPYNPKPTLNSEP